MFVYSNSSKLPRLVFNTRWNFSPLIFYSSKVPSIEGLNKINNQEYCTINKSRRHIQTSCKELRGTSFNLTDIGEGIREATVKEWFVKVGDKISQFDEICEVQSDKASVTITSRYDGVITKLYYDIDDTAYVGQPLVEIETNESEPEIKKIDKQKNDVGVVEKNEGIFEAKCIPSVRKLIKENNINIKELKGTGKCGRILKEDVLQFLGRSQVQPTNDIEINNNNKVEPIKGFKKSMMKTMSEALKIPHFVYCDEINVTKLSEIRKIIKTNAEEIGIKLTLLPFFIKAVSNALRQFPILNASIDVNCENIIYKNSHNIGIAMDTTVGLAVPVIKNVENLNILEISKELNRLMKFGKDGSFSTEDLTNGTFTISNIGAIGGTYTSPVILPPQVAIIAFGAIKILPRFDSGNNVIPEETVNISASADHRIIDGADMAHFINLLKKQIENPYLLLLL